MSKAIKDFIKMQVAKEISPEGYTANIERLTNRIKELENEKEKLLDLLARSYDECYYDEVHKLFDELDKKVEDYL